MKVVVVLVQERGIALKPVLSDKEIIILSIRLL